MFPGVTSFDPTQQYSFQPDYLARTAFYHKVRLQTPCSPSVTTPKLETPAWESLFRQYLMTLIYRSMGITTYDVIGFAQIDSYANLMTADQTKVPLYHHFLLEQRIGEEDDFNPYFSTDETLPAALYNQFNMTDHADARNGGIVPTGNDWVQFDQIVGLNAASTRYLEPVYSIRYHLLYEFGYDFDKQLGVQNLDAARALVTSPWSSEPTQRPWKLLPNDFDMSMSPTMGIASVDPPRAVSATCCIGFGADPTVPTAERAAWLVAYYNLAREMFVSPDRYLNLLDAVDRYPFYFPQCYDSQDPVQLGSSYGCSPDDPSSPRYGYYEAEKRTAKIFLRNRFLYFALYFSSARFAQETGTTFDHVLDANEEFFVREAKRYVNQLPPINPAYWNSPAPSYQALITELDALPRPGTGLNAPGHLRIIAGP